MAAASLDRRGVVVALLGTLLTRSGATQSVHAFAEDPAVGWALLAIVAPVAVDGVAALVAGRADPALSPPPAPGGIRPCGFRS